MPRRAVEWGGHGVAIALHHSQNTEQVCWVNGNSYVVVRRNDCRHYWVMADGACVDLLSINGIGEVRWDVNPRFANAEEKQAADYFGLVPAGGKA